MSMCALPFRLLRRCACAALASIAVLTVVHAPAHAADVAYDKLVEEAVAEYERGNFVEARTLFSMAHDKQPSAKTSRGLGVVEYELRDYVRAIQHFEAALADTRSALSPKQRAEVEDSLARARRFIGHFTITTDPEGAALTIDGQPIELGAAGELALNPGTYQLVVRAPEHEEQQRTLVVRGGEFGSLALRLEPVAAASGMAAGSAAPPREPAPQPIASSSSGPPTAAIVSLAVGGAGLITFAIAGSLGLAKDAELDDCAPTCDQAEVDTEKMYLVVADIGLGVGIAGAVLGTVLWLTSGDSQASETASAHGLLPWVAPGLAGVNATLGF